MCNIKRMGPTILLGLVVILLLSAVSAQAGRAFVCTTPQRLVNPNFDAGGFCSLASWVTDGSWVCGGPNFTPPGSVFQFGTPPIAGNFLAQGLSFPVFAEHIDVEIENGDGTATWDFDVFHVGAITVTTTMTHLGPGDPGVVPPPPPGSGAYKHFDAGFLATACVRGIRIRQTSGAGAPTCTDNYRVCGRRCVSIDIKPGSDPNCINPDSKGLYAVALLSEPGFDATAATGLLLTYLPSGATTTPVRTSTEDVDLDGDLDLVAHFAQSTVPAGTTGACLTGTVGGDPFKGCDAVCIPPAGEGPPD